jgi:hypothetical protein
VFVAGRNHTRSAAESGKIGRYFRSVSNIPRLHTRIGRIVVSVTYILRFVSVRAYNIVVNCSGCDYNLLKHNCNNFSDDLAHFLVGAGIPKHILDLPEDILNTPIGQTLRPLIESLSTGNFINHNGVRNNRQDSPEFLQLNNQIEEARYSVRSYP